MKEDNVIQLKSYNFALRMVKLYRFLTEKKKEYVLSKQILKSGTSIGANVEEALGAQSKADFICKLAIAYKEARETHYWIRILRDSKYITEKTSFLNPERYRRYPQYHCKNPDHFQKETVVIFNF